jgi:hypothetical protein
VTSPLNQGQQAAADGFFAFLLDDAQPYYAISGPGGVGKTHLMSHLIDQVIPQYHQTCRMIGIEPKYDEVHMTATTNKAAEVLAVATGRATSTIHSIMNLKVQDDYTKGVSKLIPTNMWHVHKNKIFFIDECSMIDTPLLQKLKEGTENCKIVFVGDHCQLAPVMEAISPVYRIEMPFYELTEQMRTNDPALQAVNQQLRETVETGVFHPIQLVPGSIDHLTDEELEAELAARFGTQTMDERILAYTNKRVMLYNDYIRDLRQLPEEYTPGELLVNNSAIQLKRQMLRVEEEVTITRQSEKTETASLGQGATLASIEYRLVDLKSRIGEEILGVRLPVDRTHHSQLLAYYKRLKDWPTFYHLKNNYPDLRQRDAATTHKAQGSTYDAVFIDLEDISTCHQPNTAARMLYVAFSRARTRVFLYGNLAPKYGGLIPHP